MGKKPTKQMYDDSDFIHSRHARYIRILAEYAAPLRGFKNYKIKDTIVFFGSARTKELQSAQKALELAKKENALAGQLQKLKTDLKMARFYEEGRKLAFRLTNWSKKLDDTEHRFIICSGGGPGIMEAANRGASEAKGFSIGLGIELPHEPGMNKYITDNLNFEFHYFFMRKYWMAYLAKALVVFPGGFGTLDELMEILTLIQTEKINKEMPIVLYGEKFWKEIINFEVLVKYGTISADDLDLFHFSESVDDAFQFITKKLKLFYL